MKIRMQEEKILIRQRRKVLKDQKLPQMKKGEKLYIENVSMNTGKDKTACKIYRSYTSCCNGESGEISVHDAKAAKTLGRTGGLLEQLQQERIS